MTREVKLMLVYWEETSSLHLLPREVEFVPFRWTESIALLSSTSRVLSYFEVRISTPRLPQECFGCIVQNSSFSYVTDSLLMKTAVGHVSRNVIVNLTCRFFNASMAVSSWMMSSPNRFDIVGRYP